MPHDSVPTAASTALDELLEVSPQVDAAIIIRRGGGSLVASAPLTIQRQAAKLSGTCVQLLDAAERARTELGREPISQVEVATQDGHVFVVADATWVVAAVTSADPTVGLVFYDLKTALRAVREAGPGSEPASGENQLVTPTGDHAAAADDDEPAGTAGSKWRRKQS